MKRTIIIIIAISLLLVLFSACAEDTVKSQFVKKAADKATLDDWIEQEINVRVNDAKILCALKSPSQTSSYAFWVSASGMKGDVQMLIITEDGYISTITDLEQHETKDGQYAFKANYLNQFVGKSVLEDDLVGTTRPNGSQDVLFVTGATISSNAVLSCVNAVVSFFSTKE